MRRPSIPAAGRAFLRKVEFNGLILLALVSGAAWAFLSIAGEVREGETHAFDDAILLWFRTPGDPANPIGPHWLEIVLRDFTGLGSVTILGTITILVIFYLVMTGKRASAILVFASIAGGVALSTVLKRSFDRPRPDVVAHLVDVHTLSFPSGHAMLSAVTYLTLGALLARTERRLVLRAYFVSAAIGLTLLVGLSRIYLGVHYPTDVLAGWSAGAFWALLCWFVARWLQRRGEVEPSG